MVRRAAASNIGVRLVLSFLAYWHHTPWRFQAHAWSNVVPLVLAQKFAATLEKEHLNTIVLPLFRALTTDDQDSVRLLAIESCAAIAQLLTPDENAQHILPIVRASVEDRSWRVRFSVAKDFFPVRSCCRQDTLKPAILQCACRSLAGD